MEYLEWWNLVFELPFAGALLYLFLMIFSGASPGHDGDVDHDVALEHDMDHGIEHIVGEHEHHVEAGVHDHGSFFVSQALHFLGIGKVPLSLILMSLAFVWGVSGWISNTLLKDIINVPGIFFWVSLVIAAASAVCGTRYIAKFMALMLPSVETYSSKNYELIGQTAEVRFMITNSSGTAQLRDKYHNLLEVPCRVRDNVALQSGIRVLLIDYDTEEKVYVVTKDISDDVEDLKRMS